MEYFDAEYAVESIREKYNKEHGIKECKVEDDYTKRKRFEKQVYRLLIMHNVPYSKKDGKYKASIIKHYIHTSTL